MTDVKRIADGFARNGWECKYATKDNASEPDITLAKNGHVYGFVEYIDLRKGTMLDQEKIDRIIYIMEKKRPKIFILVSRIGYEMYFNSQYVGTMANPISYQCYSQMSAHGADCNSAFRTELQS